MLSVTEATEIAQRLSEAFPDVRVIASGDRPVVLARGEDRPRGKGATFAARLGAGKDGLPLLRQGMRHV